MKKKAFLFIVALFSFFCFSISAKAEILYDITGLRVTDNSITISGWGFIHWKHNGNYLGGYHNTYTFNLINSSGQVVDTAVDNTANFNSSQSLSLTCIMYQQSYGGEKAKCSKYLNDGNITERNQMSFSDSGNYYYDMVDFNATFNNVKNLPEDDYYISMTITTGYNGDQETEPQLFIIPEYVSNNSNYFDTSAFDSGNGKATFMANVAVPRVYAHLTFNTGGDFFYGLDGDCYFVKGDVCNIYNKRELARRGCFLWLSIG